MVLLLMEKLEQILIQIKFIKEIEKNFIEDLAVKKKELEGIFKESGRKKMKSLVLKGKISDIIKMLRMLETLKWR